jgi:hypothetical protein
MNVEKTLEKCRAEWERQMAMEKAATPGPWEASELAPAQGKYILHGYDTYVAAFAEWDYEGNLETDMDPERSNISLSCLSRNLNPARLRVAGELIASTHQAVFSMTDEWHLRLAATLLGVEVVQ